ncbi:hypothetical protein V8E36_007071 [Tilletia maclaganii]
MRSNAMNSVLDLQLAVVASPGHRSSIDRDPGTSKSPSPSPGRSVPSGTQEALIPNRRLGELFWTAPLDASLAPIWFCAFWRDRSGQRIDDKPDDPSIQVGRAAEAPRRPYVYRTAAASHIRQEAQRPTSLLRRLGIVRDNGLRIPAHLLFSLAALLWNPVTPYLHHAHGSHSCCFPSIEPVPSVMPTAALCRAGRKGSNTRRATCESRLCPRLTQSDCHMCVEALSVEDRLR